MGTEKQPIINQMYFVYTLCYKGIIFYVGMTKDVHKRYMQHISKNNKQDTGNKIRSIIEVGDMPELNIITYTIFSHARNIEETLIKCIITGGQQLSNKQSIGSVQFKEVGIFDSKKQAIDSVIKKQNECINRCNSDNGYYIVPTIGENRYFPKIYRSSDNNTVNHNSLVE